MNQIPRTGKCGIFGWTTGYMAEAIVSEEFKRKRQKYLGDIMVSVLVLC